MILRTQSSACSFRAPVALVALAFFAASTPAAESAKTVAFTKRQVLAGPYENATVGDLDRDGNLDIVCGPFILRGPNFVPETYRSAFGAADYMHENSVHLYDVDGDGWLDIIAGGWDEDGIYWYQNP